MAAALLSYKNVNKLFKSKTKFTKVFSTNNLVILTKPQLNFVCKQCAATSYFRVCFRRPRYGAKHRRILFNFFQFYRYHYGICMRNMFLVLLYDNSKPFARWGLSKTCLSGSVGKQTKNWQNTRR